MAIKQCSKCGTEFGCTSPVAGCWCEQYIVPTEQLMHLKRNYTDCLCPDCLSGYAADKEGNDTIALNKE